MTSSIHVTDTKDVILYWMKALKDFYKRLFSVLEVYNLLIEIFNFILMLIFFIMTSRFMTSYIAITKSTSRSKHIKGLILLLLFLLLLEVNSDVIIDVMTSLMMLQMHQKIDSLHVKQDVHHKIGLYSLVMFLNYSQFL